MFDQKDGSASRQTLGYGTAAGHEGQDAPRSPSITVALEDAYQTRDYLRTLADGAEALASRLSGSPMNGPEEASNGAKVQRTPGLVHDVRTVQVETQVQAQRLEQALSQISRMIG